MNIIKKIYYYLFCNHELRIITRYYKHIDNYIILYQEEHCKKCGKKLKEKMTAKLEVKSKKILQALIKHLQLNNFYTQ